MCCILLNSLEQLKRKEIEVMTLVFRQFQDVAFKYRNAEEFAQFLECQLSEMLKYYHRNNGYYLFNIQRLDEVSFRDHTIDVVTVARLNQYNVSDTVCLQTPISMHLAVHYRESWLTNCSLLFTRFITRFSPLVICLRLFPHLYD